MLVPLAVIRINYARIVVLSVLYSRPMGDLALCTTPGGNVSGGTDWLSTGLVSHHGAEWLHKNLTLICWFATTHATVTGSQQTPLYVLCDLVFKGHLTSQAFVYN